MTGADSPVLRAWDCYAQDWLDGFTAVFRFENDDLLVWNDIGVLRTQRGTADMSTLQLDGLVSADRNSYIIWKLDAAFSNEIGRTALSAVLLNAYA